MRQCIAAAFLLAMTLLLSEGSLHTVLHDGHGVEEAHEVCDGHHHETDESQGSICAHEHQCELCVLIQGNTNFLLLAHLQQTHVSRAIGKILFLAQPEINKVLEESSPRAPPVG